MLTFGPAGGIEPSSARFGRHLNIGLLLGSTALALLGAELDGWAVGFKDNSMVIRDPSNNDNDFAGDPFEKFIYSRTSAAMQFNADGLAVWSRHNLALYSEDLSQAAWTKIGATITSTTQVVEDSATSQHGIRQAPAKQATPLLYRFEIEVKPNGRDTIELVTWDDVANGTTARVQLTGSAVWLQQQTGVGSGFTAFPALDSAVPVEDGFWRLGITFETNSAVLVACICRAYNGAASYLGDGVSGFFARKAKIQQLPVASTDYVATGAAAYYGPRVKAYDFATLESRGLLWEPARTNLCPWSRRISTALGWSEGTPGDATSAVDAVGIDGRPNQATTITMVNTANGLFYRTITVAASTRYTFAFYPKAGTATGCKFAVYDASNAAFIAQDQPYTGGAGRFSKVEYSFVTPAGCTSVRIYPIRSCVTAGTVIIDGVSLEAGPQSSSPIFCAGTGVARSSDTMRMPSTLFNPGSTEWSVYIKATSQISNAANDGSNNILFDRSPAGGFPESHYILRSANTGNLANQLVDNSVGQSNMGSIPIPVGSPFKVAVRTKAGDLAQASSHLAFATDAAATLPTGVDHIAVGSTYWSAAYGNFWLGFIEEMVFVPIAWNDNELQRRVA